MEARFRIPRWAAQLLGLALAVLVIVLAVSFLILIPVMLLLAPVIMMVYNLMTGRSFGWGRNTPDARTPRQCPKCGYSLRGLGDRGVCPECNTLFGFDVEVHHEPVADETTERPEPPRALPPADRGRP